MKQQIRKWWIFFANLGVDANLPKNEIIKVQFLNQICVAANLVTIFSNLILIFIFPIYNILSGSIAFTYTSTTLFLNYKKKYLIARHFHIILTLACQMLWVILMGARAQVEMTLFIVPVLVIFFFEKRKTIVTYFLLTILVFGICEYLQTIYIEPIIVVGNIVLTNVSLYAMVAFFVMIAMRYFRDGMMKAQAQSNQLMQQLQTKNEDLNLFTTTASHDMKEPLRMISSFGNLLERKYKKELKGDGMEYLAFIQGATSRMETLLNDLLSYSKAGIETHAPEEVDLNKIVKKVKNSLHLKIEDTNAIIESDHLPTLQLHPTAIYQVFQNLISNGLKYQPLLINSANELTHQAQINITVKKESANYLFSIQDNGIGIPTSKLPHVFDIFNRAHTQTEYEGTGVGLAICKKIVEGYGGKIWVESVEGKGASFFFTLPNNVI